VNDGRRPGAAAVFRCQNSCRLNRTHHGSTPPPAAGFCFRFVTPTKSPRHHCRFQWLLSATAAIAEGWHR
jgi:hypothetical protein